MPTIEQRTPGCKTSCPVTSNRITFRYATLAALLLILLTGCGSRGNEAPAYYYKSAGWKNVDQTLIHGNFSDYSADIKQRIDRHRVPFESQNALKEAQMAAPREYSPAENCNSDHSPEGIILLVHGLSDTAFAMHDLAMYFSSRCYVARTVLLPGHGTRPGDLLAVHKSDWLNTVRYLVQQANAEHDHVLVAGFSLGAVLTLSVALEPESSIDAVLAFSPAYTLSSYRLAKHTPWLQYARSWIDRELPDDYLRYEAMPTHGIAQTVQAMKLLHDQLKDKAGVDKPWLLVQSFDDAVTVPAENLALFRRAAHSPISRSINIVTDQTLKADETTLLLNGLNDQYRSLGVTHLGVHISPDNPHYGIDGDYRNCGTTAPRDADAVKRCLNSPEVWYGLWGKPEPDNVPTARSTFNPAFDELTVLMDDFLKDLQSVKP